MKRTVVACVLLVLGIGLAACVASADRTTPIIGSPTATFSPTEEPIAALGLRGRLVFTQGGDGLWQLDLTTGETAQLWQPPEGGRVQGVAVSPDGQAIVLAYTPPPQEGASPVVRSDLYLMRMDDEKPELLLEHQGEFESYFEPAWSPDGEWVYYTRSNVVEDEDGAGQPVLNIERVSVDGDAPEVVIENASDLSFADATDRVAYRAFNPETYQRSLFVSRADGSEARELLSPNEFLQITAPEIAPDGLTIAFSGSGRLGETSGVERQRPFLSRLAAPRIVLAHGLPADVWTVAVQGDEPVRRTFWGTDAPVPSWSPDGSLLGVLRPGGLFMLRGEAPRFLVPVSGHGDLQWVQ